MVVRQGQCSVRAAINIGGGERETLDGEDRMGEAEGETARGLRGNTGDAALLLENDRMSWGPVGNEAAWETARGQHRQRQHCG